MNKLTELESRLLDKIAVLQVAERARAPLPLRHKDRFRHAEERDYGPRYEPRRWFPEMSHAEIRATGRAAHKLAERGLLVLVAGDSGRTMFVHLTPAGIDAVAGAETPDDPPEAEALLAEIDREIADAEALLASTDPLANDNAPSMAIDTPLTLENA